MISILDIESANGVPFRVVFDPDKGTLNDQGAVSFFDRRYPLTEHGQFVSDYYRSTLMGDFDGTRGLNLHGGVEEWSVDANNMWLVVQWLRRIA